MRRVTDHLNQWILASSHNGDVYTPGELRAAGDHSSRPRTDAYSHNTHRDGDTRSSRTRAVIMSAIYTPMMSAGDAIVGLRLVHGQ